MDNNEVATNILLQDIPLHYQNDNLNEISGIIPQNLTLHDRNNHEPTRNGITVTQPETDPLIVDNQPSTMQSLISGFKFCYNSPTAKLVIAGIYSAAAGLAFGTGIVIGTISEQDQIFMDVITVVPFCIAGVYCCGRMVDYSCQSASAIHALQRRGYDDI